jgi:E3 ubiquitin-protein ligase DOA10
LAIDILAAQFLLPLLAAYIKPRDSFKQAMIFWWQAVSHQLRLSSFMFGGRYPEEEGVFVRPTLKSWVLRETCALAAMGAPFLSTGGGTSAVSFKQEGQLVRVPKRDNYETGARQTMIVPVDPVTLSPLDPVERRIDHSSMTTSEDATVVVYLPPHFETRVTLERKRLFF